MMNFFLATCALALPEKIHTTWGPPFSRALYTLCSLGYSLYEITCCSGLAESLPLCDLAELLWLTLMALQSSKTSEKVLAMAADRHCNPNASYFGTRFIKKIQYWSFGWLSRIGTLVGQSLYRAGAKVVPRLREFLLDQMESVDGIHTT